LQLPRTLLQANVQLPFAHTGVAFGALGQVVVQFPQWAGSHSVLVHAPSQFVSPPTHSSVQDPFWQTCPAGHTVVHEPQCSGFICRL